MLTGLESGDCWIRERKSLTDPRIVSDKSGHSEITCDNTSVTYVFAFNDFYGAVKGFAVPDPRIVRVQKWLQRNQVRERTSHVYV